MTREEAIAFGNRVIDLGFRDETQAFCEMAVKALEQETVPREHYESEYLARKQAEYELWKIKEQQPSEDCVDREELKKWLDMNFSFGGALRKIELFDRLDKELPPVTPTTCIAKVTFSKDDLQELVDEKVEELAQHMESRWIPVSERLPEKNGKYLAYIINKKDTNLQYIMTCEYYEGDLWNWFPDDDCASDNVVAWMPLPEPYKAEMESEE